jgi:predicted Zn-dependent protease
MNLALNPILINPDKPFEAFASFPKPKAEDTAAQQIEWLVLQANLSLKKDDLPSAIRRLKAAIALSPKDYPETRVMLGKLYLDKEQPADAERLLREAYSSWPESVMLVELLEKALTRQDKFKEAWEMSDKVYELEKIYRNW